MNTEEQNFKKLRRTTIPMNFIKKNQGQWDHELWLGFCGSLEKKGYLPINFDEVGLLLESKRVKYLSIEKR